MARKDYEGAVREIMMDNEVFGSYHAENFKTFYEMGSSCPINSSIINDKPEGRVILSEQVYDMLEAIADVANNSLEEVPFFLYGIESLDGTVEFTEFMSTTNEKNGETVAFSQDMVEYLQNRVEDEFNDGLVVCHGHSHPPLSKFHQNFTLGEFAGYMQINEENEIFRNKKVLLLGCVVTATGDVNFVMYDVRKKDFFRYTQVFVKDEVGTLTPVNTFVL